MKWERRVRMIVAVRKVKTVTRVFLSWNALQEKDRSIAFVPLVRAARSWCSSLPFCLQLHGALLLDLFSYFQFTANVYHLCPFFFSFFSLGTAHDDYIPRLTSRHVRFPPFPWITIFLSYVKCLLSNSLFLVCLNIYKVFKQWKKKRGSFTFPVPCWTQPP